MVQDDLKEATKHLPIDRLRHESIQDTTLVPWIPLRKSPARLKCNLRVI